MSAEERDTPQVKQVFELLVRQHPDYTDFEVIEDWAWARKLAVDDINKSGADLIKRIYDDNKNFVQPKPKAAGKADFLTFFRKSR